MRWAGDRSLILDFDTLDAAMSARAALDADAVDGQVDLIAGARTLLVRLRSHWHAVQALPQLRAVEFPSAAAPSAAEHLIDVVYDGEDLGAVATALNMSTEALVNWHTKQTWLAAFSGVAGFAYCVAQGESLSVPRRPTPRTTVPGGSVMLAAGFSGIYPRTGPSGWQIIGQTKTHVWDPERERPSLINPWDTVHYRPIHRDTLVTGVGTAASAASRCSSVERTHCFSSGQAAFEVLDAGMLSLIEDRGRTGASSDGLGISGIIDRLAGSSGNEIVGNTSDAPVVESLLGQLRIRALRTVVLAVTGARVEITIDSDTTGTRTESMDTPFAIVNGERLSLGTPQFGARTVVAVRGGLAAAKTLGSSSTDTHTGVGPSPLAAGDVVRIGSTSGAVTLPGRTAAGPAAGPEVVELRCILGPRDDWFSSEERNRFARQTWEVTADSDRIGLRLRPAPGGNPLTRKRAGELLSEGMALGSVQIPPSGNPVLLLNDQAITGGYPIIAVVVESDLNGAGQLVPGDCVRFQPVDPGSPGLTTVRKGAAL